VTAPIEVLLIDDHRMFSDALELLLRGEDGLAMIGAAGSAEDALEMCTERCPNVVLMDIDLPGIDGIQATRRVKKLCPEAQVVIITAYQDRRVMARAIDAGASGFVPKTQAFEHLLEIINRAAAGEKVLPSTGIFRSLPDRPELSHRRSEAERLLRTLTSREIQVLAAVAHGKATLEIARLLGITPFTVQTHVKNILSKLGVHSKLEAAALALRFGLIQIPPGDQRDLRDGGDFRKRS